MAPTPIVALPNSTTPTIVLGPSSATHAGEGVLDVDTPGFRGASTIGAIVAAILVLLLRKQRRVGADRRAEAGVVTAPDPGADARSRGDTASRPIPSTEPAPA